MHGFPEEMNFRLNKECNKAYIDFGNIDFSISLVDHILLELKALNFIKEIYLSGGMNFNRVKRSYILRGIMRIFPYIPINLNTDFPDTIFLSKSVTEDIAGLREIFLENHVSNGGSLYCIDSSPSQELFKVSSSTIYSLVKLSAVNTEHLMGYATIQNSTHPDVLNSEMIVPIDLNNCSYIMQLAVKSRYQGMGNGNFIIKDLKSIYSRKTLLSHVNVDNSPSLKLHYRNEFNKVGMFRSSVFQGVSSYYRSDLVAYVTT